MQRAGKIFALAAVFFVLFFTVAYVSRAFAYPKPQNVPTFNIPDHGVTIAIWAESSIVGQFIGVFELQNGDWKVCNSCFTNPEFPDMNSAVTAVGGPPNYVALKVPEINAILAARYPAIGTPGTILQQVTGVLNGYAIRFVNGVPNLYKP